MNGHGRPVHGHLPRSDRSNRTLILRGCGCNLIQVNRSVQRLPRNRPPPPPPIPPLVELDARPTSSSALPILHTTANFAVRPEQNFMSFPPQRMERTAPVPHSVGFRR
jgi:hypothetical protein